MLPRFLVPDLDQRRPDAVLPAGEAHHLTHVLRLGVGAAVAVFDGRGCEYRAQVASVTRRGVTVRLLERSEQGAVLPEVDLTVVQSVLKGSAMDTVVRDCTMIGIRAIQPVVSQRTAVSTTSVARARVRWDRIALASAKQCGRSVLPEIAEPMAFDEWTPAPEHEAAFLLVEPSAETAGVLRIRQLVSRPGPRAAALIVGPEGGWTRGERDHALTVGCVPLSLGRMTLRAESVSFAAAAILLAIWES